MDFCISAGVMGRYEFFCLKAILFLTLRKSIHVSSSDSLSVRPSNTILQVSRSKISPEVTAVVVPTHQFRCLPDCTVDTERSPESNLSPQWHLESRKFEHTAPYKDTTPTCFSKINNAFESI